MFQGNVGGNYGGAIFIIDSSILQVNRNLYRILAAQQSGTLAFSGTSKLILTDPLLINFIENGAYT